MPTNSKRPGIVITAAILLFVYGAICMQAGCFGVAISFHPGLGHGPQPAPGQREELRLVHGLYLVLAIVMCFTGVGLLRLIRAARWAAYCVTVCHVFLIIAHDIFVLLTVGDPRRLRLGLQILTDSEFWVYLGIPTIMSLMLTLSIITLLSLKRSRVAFAIQASPRLGDDWAAVPAKSPGDTRITEFPNAT